VQDAPIVQLERDGHISLVTGIYQQRAGKPWLHHDPVPARELEDNEFGAPPGAHNSGSRDAAAERAGADFAQDVRVPYLDARNRAASDRAVEIPRDRLGFR
jgi:hypothetical protein